MWLKEYKYKILSLALFVACPVVAWADKPPMCGGVNYGYGAAALVDACHYVVEMLIGTILILKVLAGIISVISALQITIKMNYHEGEITKNIVYLVGSLLFLLFATIVIPAVFGWNYTGGNMSWGNTSF